MKQELLIILVICAFTAAMAPRDRRAVDTEESQAESATKICAKLTPCAWSRYKPNTEYIQEKITNNYCVCAKDTVCDIAEDDKAAAAYVHRCVPRGEASNDS